MIEDTFRVRFYETDALKHVSNTTLVQWFEATRDPYFAFYALDLTLKLVLAITMSICHARST